MAPLADLDPFFALIYAAFARATVEPYGTEIAYCCCSDDTVSMMYRRREAVELECAILLVGKDIYLHSKDIYLTCGIITLVFIYLYESTDLPGSTD